jgi:hypothetical protein
MIFPAYELARADERDANKLIQRNSGLVNRARPSQYDAEHGQINSLLLEVSKLHARRSSACHEPGSRGAQGQRIMKNKNTFFDAATITFLREVLDDAWARLPPDQTAVSQSLLAERILKAAKAGERDPTKLRARAITEGTEDGL